MDETRSPQTGKNVDEGKMKSYNRKRKKPTSDVDNIDTKGPTPKILKVEFTVIDFKLMLKDPNTIFVALDKFVVAAETYPDHSDVDIIASYCQSSPECSEIFQVLAAGTRRPTELHTIFTVLEAILLGTADGSDSMKQTGVCVVQRILTSHLGSVMYCLGMKHKSGQIKAALKLLTAMVLQQGCAKDVQAQFNFTHANVTPIFSRRDSKDPEDVRTCVLQFCMAFLISSMDSGIRLLVEQKGFLINIFNGLQFDTLNILQVVLPMLLEKVVLNRNVSKTGKVQLFNESSLRQLGQLYFWKGPGRWKDKKDDLEQVELDSDLDDQREAVAALAHDLLLNLCCDVKLGINFFDKTYGTSGRNQNHVLSSLLNSLSRVLDNPRIQVLVIRILQVCPDQIGRYMTSVLQGSASPRPSQKWLTCVDFIIRIYQSQPDVPPILMSANSPHGNKLVDILKVSLLPPGTIYNSMIPGLKHKDLLVRHTVLRLLCHLLHKVSTVFMYCSENSQTPHMSDTLQRFREAVLKMLPDVKTIFACIERILRSDGNPVIADITETADASQGKDLPAVSMTEHVVLVEQVLCFYQELVPSTLSDNNIDLSQLIESVRNMAADSDDGNVQSDGDIMPQLYLLKLLAKTDARKLPWGKANKGGNNLMFLFLDMLSKGDHNPKLLLPTQYLIAELLVGTGLFERSKEEIFIWLRPIPSAKSDSKKEIFEFVSSVFTMFIGNPYPYNNKLSELISEAGLMSLPDASTETSSIGTTDSMIDAILEMDDGDDDDDLDISDTMIADSGQLTSCSDSARLPFTPLLIVALEMCQKIKDCHQDIHRYLEQVMLQLFHIQIDPVSFCLLMKKFSYPNMDESLKNYILSWQPCSKISPKVKLETSENEIRQNCEDFPSLLRLLRLHGASVMKPKLFDSKLDEILKSMSLASFLPSLKQLLLYIRGAIDMFCMASNRMGNLLQVYFKIWKSLLSLLMTSTHITEETNVLSMEEFSVLEVKPATPGEIMVTSIELLFSNPVLSSWFLLPPNLLDRNVWTSEASSSLCGKVTTCVIELMSCMSAPSSDAVQRILHPTIQRVLKVLSDASLQNIEDTMSTCFRTLDILLPYMKDSSVMETVKTVFSIPIDTLASLSVKHPDTLTNLLKFIADNQYIYALRELPVLSKCFVFATLSFSANEQISPILCELITQCPEFALTCSKAVLHNLLEHPMKQQLALVDHILEHNIVLLQSFEDWLLKKHGMKEKNKYAGVVTSYLKALHRSPTCNSVNCVKVIYKTYKKSFTVWIAKPSNESDSSCLALIKEMVSHKAIDDTLLEDILLKLASQIETGACPSSQHVELFHLIVMDTDSIEQKDAKTGGVAANQAIVICMKGLLQEIGKKEEKNSDIENSILTTLDALAENVDKSSNLIGDIVPIWMKFIQTTLRACYTDIRLLRFIKHLLLILYSGESDMPVTVTTLYDMIMSHSMFLKVMFETENMDAKDAIAALLLTMADMSPECCKTVHFSVLLGAYQASLSLTDQKLLKLMHLYEKNAAALTEYRPYLWGQKAIESHAMRKNLGPSLWKQPTMEQVLDNLDHARLHRSTLKFPLARHLLPADIMEAKFFKSEEDCYDPCFLLPLFSYLLAPESVVDCRKFIEVHCLGYVCAALSSRDSRMRGAAYHVIQSYVYHLQGGRFWEREQVEYLLDLLRNSLDAANIRLPSVISQFIVKALQILLKPDNHMYLVLNSFLLIKPTMDIDNVPEFYKLFNSSSLEFKQERAWILSLMVDGLRETCDYKIFEKRYVFKLLQSYHDSSLSDAHNRRQVLQIISTACCIKPIALNLVKNHGIITWLTGVISRSSSSSQEHQCLLVDILHNLWHTLLDGRDICDATKCRPCLPEAFTRAMLLALNIVMCKFSINQDADIYKKYMSTLSSVLEHKKVTSNLEGDLPILQNTSIPMT